MVDGCRCCAIGYKAVDESTSGHVRYAMVATVLVPKVPKGIRKPLVPMEETKKMVDESMDWGRVMMKRTCLSWMKHVMDKGWMKRMSRQRPIGR